MKTTENLSTMHIPGPLSSDPGTEEKWALVQRIAASEHFSRSVRLRDFLLYVGRQAVSANSSELNEQEVGFRVFGRSPDYDRSQDNIVRVNATELRRRIEAYFASAGQNEQLILEIPRGSYKPVFHHRTDAPQPTPEENKATPLPAKKRRWFRSNLIPGWILIASLSLSVLSGIWCLILLQQNRHLRSLQEPWSGKPAVASFWKNFLAGNGPIDIVLPDDSASVIEDITGVSINLNDYLSRNFLRNVQSMPLSDDRRGDVFQLYNHNLVTFGGVRAAQQIMSQIPPGYGRDLYWARSYTADAIKRDSVVLIGGQKSDPWNYIFNDQLNFIADYDGRGGFIRNRHPQPGEQDTYSVFQGKGEDFASYAVVAYLPNPSHTGHVLILAGLDSDATAAAAEYLTSESQMTRLHQLLKHNDTICFELLLKTSRLSGTSLHSEPLVWRAYPNLY